VNWSDFVSLALIVLMSAFLAVSLVPQIVRRWRIRHPRPLVEIHGVGYRMAPKTVHNFLLGMSAVPPDFDQNAVGPASAVEHIEILYEILSAILVDEAGEHPPRELLMEEVDLDLAGDIVGRWVP